MLVVDPMGEPLAEARVAVLRRMPVPAGGARGLPPMPRLIPVPSPGSQTNDLGEFRVSGLAPGEYFIAVSPRSVAMFGTAGSSPARDWKMARTTLPTTYYPGTSGISGGAVTWSSSPISGRGAMPQPLEIVVADADVTGVQVVARRPSPR